MTVSWSTDTNTVKVKLDTMLTSDTNVDKY